MQRRRGWNCGAAWCWIEGLAREREREGEECGFLILASDSHFLSYATRWKEYTRALSFHTHTHTHMHTRTCTHAYAHMHSNTRTHAHNPTRPALFLVSPLDLLFLSPPRTASNPPSPHHNFRIDNGRAGVVWPARVYEPSRGHARRKDTTSASPASRLSPRAGACCPHPPCPRALSPAVRGRGQGALKAAEKEDRGQPGGRAQGACTIPECQLPRRPAPCASPRRPRCSPPPLRQRLQEKNPLRDDLDTRVPRPGDAQQKK